MLNTNLTLQIAKQTTGLESGFTAINCNYARMGNLVTLSYKINYTSIPTNQTLALTIPSGYRPTYEVGCNGKASGSVNISIQINTDGQLLVNASTTLSSGTLAFSVTYASV